MPREVIVGDEVLLETGTVAVVRAVYSDRLVVSTGDRTVTMNVQYE